jgi:hypothetical protein
MAAAGGDLVWAALEQGSWLRWLNRYGSFVPGKVPSPARSQIHTHMPSARSRVSSVFPIARQCGMRSPGLALNRPVFTFVSVCWEMTDIRIYNPREF